MALRQDPLYCTRRVDNRLFATQTHHMANRKVNATTRKMREERRALSRPATAGINIMRASHHREPSMHKERKGNYTYLYTMKSLQGRESPKKDFWKKTNNMFRPGTAQERSLHMSPKRNTHWQQWQSSFSLA